MKASNKKTSNQDVKEILESMANSLKIVAEAKKKAKISETKISQFQLEIKAKRTQILSQQKQTIALKNFKVEKANAQARSIALAKVQTKQRVKPSRNGIV